MHIALNTNSLSSGHKYRGLGFYTKRLITGLKSIHDLNLTTFTQKIPKKTNLVHYPAFTLFHPQKNLNFKKPVIFTVHDLIPLKYPKKFPPGLKGKIAWLIQKNNLKKASAIITDSKASKKDIIKFTGIDKNKIQVIYLAADSIFKPIKDKSWLSKIKKRYQLPSKFVLYVGDLNYNKNIPMLIETCLKLNYPLVVIGKQAMAEDFDKAHPETKDLVKFQQLAKNNSNKIFRLGFVPVKDLVGIYNLATIYAHPSLAEGFGLPILEAFACGCPVITSKSTSTEEIAGKAALLINPRKELKLKSALKSLWQSKTLRSKFSKLGLKQVKNFSWQKTANQTHEVYKKTL